MVSHAYMLAYLVISFSVKHVLCAKFYNTPMHEVSQFPTYLGTSPTGEVVVTYSGKGADLHPDDYITHADEVRLLTGSLSDFLASGQREAAIPIVDDEDIKFGGSRLLGFVMIQSILPRKLQSRRGEIEFDLEEGGPAPDIQVGNVVIGGGSVKTVDAEDYTPPPHGGGRCITARDCFFGNGTCPMGACACIGDYTGTYCQLYRPETGSIAKMAKKAKSNAAAGAAAAAAKPQEQPPAVNPNLPKPPPEELAAVPKVEYRKAQADVEAHAQAQSQAQAQAEAEVGVDGSAAGGDGGGGGGQKKRKLKPGAKKMKPKPKPGDEAAGAQEAGTRQQEQQQQSPPEQQQQPEEIGQVSRVLTEEQRMEAILKLYGSGKAYPEPYLAGKVPKEYVHLRHKARIEKNRFVYAVRFRTGPFGLSFNNRINNQVIIERVLPGQQAEASDIQVGDQLIAVDQYNTTQASPKDIQRLTSTLSWPRILVFETKGGLVDPKKVEEHQRAMTLNVTVVYPPPLVGEFQARLADWTPSLDSARASRGIAAGGLAPAADACSIYYLRAAPDQFGCETEPAHYAMPPEVLAIIGQKGNVGQEEEARAPMLTALLKESERRQVPLAYKAAGIMKRGVCSFVAKAKAVATADTGLALMVNSDETLMELPAGKDNTTLCTTPTAALRSGDGALLQLTAGYQQEVLLVVHPSSTSLSTSCTRAVTMIEDVIDQWAHSVPHMPVSTVLSTKAPGKERLRPPADEGGRIAVGGENGWAFFDYHLAVFGPQEVPLGPYRLQMAFPPHGCDPGAYSVRIKDTVVAILRGGGCSFGIKVINAQKLGAKAVIMVNTDDVKTMRLMAMPDEEPLIKIPCITVSRRLQFYLEKQLRFFYTLDQHTVSIQPTGLFGDYEDRNSLKLPERLPGH